MASVLQYDPKQNAWTHKTPLPKGACCAAATIGGQQICAWKNMLFLFYLFREVVLLYSKNFQWDIALFWRSWFVSLFLYASCPLFVLRTFFRRWPLRARSGALRSTYGFLSWTHPEAAAAARLARVLHGRSQIFPVLHWWGISREMDFGLLQIQHYHGRVHKLTAHEYTTSPPCCSSGGVPCLSIVSC